ncbi:MAG: hypothetical protein OEW23_18125 [Candidatus Aminicenantes bacterium]|nr:hypothetical protein [Candidatus Aminicenantes bacterium]
MVYARIEIFAEIPILYYAAIKPHRRVVKAIDGYNVVIEEAFQHNLDSFRQLRGIKLDAAGGVEQNDMMGLWPGNLKFFF